MAVYGYAKNYDVGSQKGVGTDVTYHTYHLNDRVVLSMGGAFDVVEEPDDMEGYTEIPVKFRPHAGVCYSEGNFKACVNNSLSMGASNYGENNIYVQYSIPLTDKMENAPYLVIRGSGGIITGGAPIVEQFYQMSTKMPFSFSITNGEIYFGKHYEGAAAELTWRPNGWVALKPIVLSAMMVGEYAKFTSGSCIVLGPMQFCAGYRKGLMNSQDGLDISLGPDDTLDVPAQVRAYFDQIFLRSPLTE